MRGEIMVPEAQAILSSLTESIADNPADAADSDALERADRESELADWLEQQGLPIEVAGDLVGAGITPEK